MRIAKNTIVFLLLTFFTTLQAQTQDRKFDFGINLFPNYSIGIVTNDGSAPMVIESVFEKAYTWKPSISTNLFVEYRLSNKSAIGLGLGYQNNGEKTKKADLVYGHDPITGEPINNPALPDQAKFIYNHHNIEIPLYFKYNFGTKFYLLAGTSGIVNLSNTSTSVQYFENNSKQKSTGRDYTTEFRGFNFTGNLGFGFNYLKKEKMTLFVHPYAQYGFLDISKTASLNRTFLSIGISTGIRI